MENRHDRYAVAAAAVLALGVGIEGFRLVGGHTWPGYAPALSRAVSTSLIVLFSVTAVSAILRRRNRLFASLAWTLAALCPMFMVAHAAITRVGGALVGLIYLALAAAVGLFMKRTLDRGERFSLPTRNPGGRVRGAEKGYRLIPRPRG
jgi:hypothetical protein